MASSTTTEAGSSSDRLIIVRHKHPAASESRADTVAVEEPLEIRLGFGPLHARRQESIAITMRTPGHDAHLALGFLFTEGVIGDPSEIKSVGPCQEEGLDENNVLRVELQPSTKFDLDRLQRHFYTSSSCGVCGKRSLQALASQTRFELSNNDFSITAEHLFALPERLREHQQVFAQTGALHAAASFDRHGTIQAVFEDVGRHNALDKLIGDAFSQSKLPLAEYGLLLSGRASFELVQKAVMAGCPLLAAIGGPSSLAVDSATQFKLSLIGFLKPQRMVIYSNEQRLQ